MGVAPTFTDGTVVHDTDLTFALDPPRVKVYDNTGVVCTNGVAKLLTFDTEVYDTDSMWSGGASSRILINTSGVYQFIVYLAMPVATYTVLNFNPRRNSAGSASGGTSIRTMPTASLYDTGQGPVNRFTFEMQFTAGEYVELFVTQTSGGSRTTSTGAETTGVTARWVAYL